MPLVGVTTPADELLPRFAEAPPQLRDGDLPQRRRAAAVTGQHPQRLPHCRLLGGPERHLLRADEPTDQHEPASEDDGFTATGLCGVQSLPVLTEGTEVEGVDARRQAMADDE